MYKDINLSLNIEVYFVQSVLFIEKRLTLKCKQSTQAIFSKENEFGLVCTNEVAASCNI